MIERTVDPDGRGLYRVGGVSALVLGLAYLAIFPLFARVGAPPTGGEAWLKYLDGKTTAWWAILSTCAEWFGRKLNTHLLRTINIATGIILIVFGCYHLGKLLLCAI